MQGMVKVWTTSIGYSRINEGKAPDRYWLTKPAIECVELTLSIELVQSWKPSTIESKVNKKQMLFG